MRSRPSPAVTELLTYLVDLGFEELQLGRAEASAEPPAAASATPRTAPAETPPTVPAALAARADAAEALARQAAAAVTCTRCRLAEGRRTVVFGMGSADADLMFIGEGPGAQEDRQGLPFVGPAGELLTRIIQAIDLRREDVYIANIVKCRPPGNRDPRPNEVAACRGWLHDQIETIKPRVIVMLGKVAAQTLLGSDEPLGRMRGSWHRVLGVDARATYHPAALLRNASFKRPTWEDMQVVRDRLREGAAS
ncbi:MAG: uracil-DNA glycosylase [Thermoanaerobaculia bacterium]